MTEDEIKRQTQQVKDDISKAIDGHAGMIWRSAENAWTDVSADFPPGITAHCMQIVYVIVNDADGKGTIGGVALSASHDLKADNVRYIMAEALARMPHFGLRPVNPDSGKKLS